MTITIATVFYGGEKLLQQTVPTWFQAAAAYPGIYFSFVDNSPDPIKPLLAGLDGFDANTVDYVHRPHNPGFAASANEALQSAGTDWVFLVNPDVYLDTTSLGAIIKFATGSHAYDVAAVSMLTAGKWMCGIALSSYGYFVDRTDVRTACLGASGGAGLFKRDTFLHHGGFDDDLFAWGEDAGLAIRMRAAGISVAQLDLRLVHEGGHSVDSLRGQRFKAALLARNRIRVLRRGFARSLAYTLGPVIILTMLINGIRKIPAGTASPHFTGMFTGLSERNAHSDHPKLSLSQFLDYRRATAE